MKIALVTGLYREQGGAEYYLLAVARMLEAAGHALVVLYDEQHPRTLPPTIRPSCRIAGLSRFHPLRYPAVRAAVDTFLQLEQPDLVWFHYTENWPLVWHIAARWPAVRFVHDATLACFRHWKLLPDSDTWCPHAAGLSCWRRGCVRRPRLKFPEIAAHNRLRRIIVASTCMRDLLLQNGIKRERLAVLPYFVDAPPAAPPAFPAANPPHILFAGLVHHIKGVDHFLRALAQLPGPFTAAVVGDMPEAAYAAKCRELVATAGLAERVHFTGWIPPLAVREHYRRAAMVVMPSIWLEAFGIVGIEAMAHARPVIAYAAGGPRDWLADGETGFLVERGSLTGLTDGMRQLLQQPDMAQAMGRAGRRHFEQRYTPERHLQALLQLFIEAV